MTRRKKISLKFDGKRKKRKTFTNDGKDFCFFFFFKKKFTVKCLSVTTIRWDGRNRKKANQKADRIGEKKWSKKKQLSNNLDKDKTEGTIKTMIEHSRSFVFPTHSAYFELYRHRQRLLSSLHINFLPTVLQTGGWCVRALVCTGLKKCFFIPNMFMQQFVGSVFMSSMLRRLFLSLPLPGSF